MSRELVEPTTEFLGNRDWGRSIAVTLNLKQSRKIEHPTNRFIGSFNIAIDEYQITASLRHFSNRLNRRWFGNNWRRYNKRIEFVSAEEGYSSKNTRGYTRKHIHLRFKLPFAAPQTFDEMREFEAQKHQFVKSIRDCWAKIDWAYGSYVGFHADDGWSDYLAKPKTKEHYDQSVPWDVISLPSKASQN